MTTKRRASAPRSGGASRKRTTSGRTTAGRSTAGRSGTTRRRTTSTRRRNSTATTLGAAVGTVVVAFLLGAPWSVRIALVVLLVLAGAGYLIWSRRS